ncbi:helix-turn-helix domain-containing protein [Hydrogenophaga sp. T2]|uniref:helix-turn-helix domain-containing protein n=1 Tax=Hydrogenophaga sp. T2 TaxID=3132823 RepID=UPI003CF94FD7
MSEPAPELLPCLARLAANLRALRAESNWTSSALADQAHVSRRMLQLLEMGKVNVSLGTVDKLARALGVTTGSLLGKRPAARQASATSIEQVLASNLQSARKERQMTQEALAQRSGISRPVIAHIERQARNPSLQTLARLAAALDLSVEGLLSK